MKPRGTAQGEPMRAPLTAVSAFQRRTPAHFLRRPRMGKIATSVITRVYAEKAAQRNGSVRLCERSSGEPCATSAHGAKRTWRDVRLESVTRTKADID